MKNLQQESIEPGAANPEIRDSSLDLPAEVLHEINEVAQDFVEEYFATINDLPTFPSPEQLHAAKLLRQPLPMEGATVERLISDCRIVKEAGRHTAHPRFFGYVSSPANPVGVAADFIASALNQNLPAWRSSPAATEVERTVVNWLGTLTGFAEVAKGILTSGGSMANLNALYIASRAKSKTSVSRTGLGGLERPLTLYVSDQVHMSVPKAADVLGLGRDNVRVVGTDDRFKLDVRDLRERIEADKHAGVQPFCVIASAGTVNTGAIDPLLEIAKVARENDLWFHVDGAYGALGAMAEKMRASFAGMELADSVSLDPHKWLYMSIDCGCLLFRDSEIVRKAFSSGEVDYIKIHETESDEAFAYWDYGIELTRRFRALKVWMTLRYYGARRLAEAIADDIALAQYLADQIKSAEDFDLLAPVELSICCFRYVPSQARELLESSDDSARDRVNQNLDDLNERLTLLIQRSGRAYLSNAMVRGRYALRICIANFRTTRSDIDATLNVIREIARNLGT